MSKPAGSDRQFWSSSRAGICSYRLGFSRFRIVSSSRPPRAGCGSLPDSRPPTSPPRRAGWLGSSKTPDPGSLSHRASLSGRLGAIGSVGWRSARYAFDTGEAIVNPISGASSLSANAGTEAATTLFSPRQDVSGLAEASGPLGVPLDPEALARFACYRDLLLERSAQFNLTAIRDPDEIERRLFVDAIAMVPAP